MMANQVATLEVHHVRRSLTEGQEEEEDLQPTMMTLELKSLNSKGNLIQMSFFKWLHIVERIYKYKEVLDDKKVKLFDLRL